MQILSSTDSSTKDEIDMNDSVAVLTVNKKTHRIKKRWLISGCCAAFLCLAIASYVTNPFNKFSLVQQPFFTQTDGNGQFELIKNEDISIKNNFLYQIFANLKGAYYITSNVYSQPNTAHASQLNDIIRQIHELRFSPQNIFLISGDHFSMLYPRSLGIFYHSLLDPRTALDQNDWKNREDIYLRTTAYALNVFDKAPSLSTTISPVGRHSVALINVYQPPSDTLYSLLYALRTMQTSDDIKSVYAYPSESTAELHTQAAAQELLQKYTPSLQRHYRNYTDYVIDKNTGLVRKDILLSGTKDVAKRHSAFYDNVILWKTKQLAQQLHIVPENHTELQDLKTKIIANFWKDNPGCFIEDLSRPQYHYSSDWLIVLSTGFLDPKNEQERKYFEGCISYIQKEKLDQPFGLRYQQTNQSDHEYIVTRLFAPAYGGTAIWSNWGMEYIKLLTILSQQTNQKEYLATAQQQLKSYSDNIVKYRCYPEVYDKNGKMFKTLFYRSVCQTGWVVSYEQARKMVEATASSPQ